MSPIINNKNKQNGRQMSIRISSFSSRQDLLVQVKGDTDGDRLVQVFDKTNNVTSKASRKRQKSTSKETFLLRKNYTVARSMENPNLSTIVSSPDSISMSCTTNTTATRSSKTSRLRNKPESPAVYWKNSNDPFYLRYDSYSYNGTTWKMIEPNHTTDNDQNLEHTKNTTKKKYIQFQVRGNPLSLRRHRTARGYMYNPSAADQEIFRSVVTSMLPDFLIPLRDEESFKTQDGELYIRSLSSTTKITTGMDSSTFRFHSSSHNSPSPFHLIPPFFHSDEYLSVRIIFYLKRPKKHFIGNQPGSSRIRPIYQSSLPMGSRTDVDNLAKFVLDSFNGFLYEDDRQVVSLSVTKLLHSVDDFQGSTEIVMERIHDVDLDRLLHKT